MRCRLRPAILSPCLLLFSSLALAETPKHWAFQPVADPPTPVVRDAAWSRTTIDRFLLAALEAKGLRPSPEADRRTLIRRVTLDLVGLPPTSAEVEAFATDPSPDAYDARIEQLLASPRYGERWGRHWLDVARYADSNGLDENVAHGNAFKYRDYVVRSFNADKPYDRFLVEQLAGDLVESDMTFWTERLTATGFLSLGPKVLAEPDELKMEMDIIDEQVDTVGRAVMGLTLGCARCHDHKFDPVSQEDYYALAGMFRSTKTMEQHKAVAKWLEYPNDGGIMAVMDGKIADTPLLRRGDHLKPGKMIPRRFPSVLAGDNQTPIPTTRSGRRELARWLTKSDHPLTARVMVNRVWRWHFGTGLVRSTDNFGLLGETPSHPALLDHLARQFVESGWSLKALHRQIVRSSAYRQSSVNDGRGATIDADDRLLWRFPTRRLEAEVIRDSLLAIGGQLDDRIGGPSLEHVKNRGYLFDHTSKDLTKYDSRRRSLYLPVIRNHMYDVFSLFDCTDAAVISGDRATTTVATQALFWMNAEMVASAADGLASRLLSEFADDGTRLRELYLSAYGRPPTPREIERCAEAIRKFDGIKDQRRAWALLCHAILAGNEFVYVP